MNWTGGVRSRHAQNGKSASSRKVKEHFAKIHGQRLNGGSKTPPKYLIFGKIKVGGRSEDDHCDDDEPNRHTYKHEGRGSSKGSEQEHSIKELSFRQEPEHSDRNALKPHRSNHRRSYSSIEVNRPSPTLGDSKIETLAQKRQRILQKTDWSGSKLRQPAQHKYEQPENSEMVGRRRTEDPRRRSTKRKAIASTKLASPFSAPKRTTKHDRAGKQQRLDTNSPQAMPDLRIRIGKSLISTEHTSQASFEALQSSREQLSHGGNSDVMLFDEEDLGFRHDAFRSTGKRISEGRKTHGSVSCRVVHRKHDYNHSSNAVHPRSSPPTASRILLPRSGSSRVRLPRNILSQENEYSVTEFHQCSNERSGGATVSDPSLSMPLHHPKPQSSKTSIVLRSESSEIPNSTEAKLGQLRPMVPPGQIRDNEIWKAWMFPKTDRHEVELSSSPFIGQKNPSSHIVSPGISTIVAQKKTHHNEDTVRIGKDDFFTEGEKQDDDIYDRGTGTRSASTADKNHHENITFEDSNEQLQPTANRQLSISPMPIDYRKTFTAVSWKSNIGKGNTYLETGHKSLVGMMPDSKPNSLGLPRSTGVWAQKPSRKENPDDSWMAFVFPEGFVHMEEGQEEIRPVASPEMAPRDPSGQQALRLLPSSIQGQPASSMASSSILDSIPNFEGCGGLSSPFRLQANGKSTPDPVTDSPPLNNKVTSVSESLVVYAGTVSSLTNLSDGSSTSNLSPRQKVIFTKPQRYINNASANHNLNHRRRNTLYIGKKNDQHEQNSTRENIEDIEDD